MSARVDHDLIEIMKYVCMNKYAMHFPSFLLSTFSRESKGAKKVISTVPNLPESSPLTFVYQSGSLGHVCNGSDGLWVTNK